MKFGQGFQASLERGEYPREWIDSAISYKKLKKCIKRVQQELRSYGLDQETLNALWQHVNRTGPSSVKGDRLLHYDDRSNGKVEFTPKLTIAIDPRDGSPMDAWLSPETRRHLQKFAHSPNPKVVEVDDSGSLNGDQLQRERQEDRLRTENCEDDTNTGRMVDQTEPSDLETIEIPLTSDSEFFQILRREVANLDKLQSKEQSSIELEIVQLGEDLRKLKLSKKRRSKEEIQAWRRIFELYNDAEIFLSSHEADAGARDVPHAQKQLEYFNKQVADSPSSARNKLGRDATIAVDRFLKINLDLLRLMKYQDINRTALTKIMKKFDKQTALHAQATIPDSLKSKSLITTDLAKATCFTISEEILQIIPQLSDYICPVCFSVTYKPVRLSCNHVFCIRCMVVMQRENQKHCPLCRAEVVLAADAGKLRPSIHKQRMSLIHSDNIDYELKHFLEKNFKAEVKEKQKANEEAVAIDNFGELHGKPMKCVVM
jgi:E3 ubiquitin-protein ligase BAH